MSAGLGAASPGARPPFSGWLQPILNEDLRLALAALDRQEHGDELDWSPFQRQMKAAEGAWTFWDQTDAAALAAALAAAAPGIEPGTGAALALMDHLDALDRGHAPDPAALRWWRARVLSAPLAGPAPASPPNGAARLALSEAVAEELAAVYQALESAGRSGDRRCLAAQEAALARTAAVMGALGWTDLAQGLQGLASALANDDGPLPEAVGRATGALVAIENALQHRPYGADGEPQPTAPAGQRGALEALATACQEELAEVWRWLDVDAGRDPPPLDGPGGARVNRALQAVAAGLTVAGDDPALIARLQAARPSGMPPALVAPLVAQAEAAVVAWSASGSPRHAPGSLAAEDPFPLKPTAGLTPEAFEAFLADQWPLLVRSDHPGFWTALALTAHGLAAVGHEEPARVLAQAAARRRLDERASQSLAFVHERWPPPRPPRLAGLVDVLRLQTRTLEQHVAEGHEAAALSVLHDIAQVMVEHGVWPQGTP